MKTFSSVTLFTFQPDDYTALLDVPWPRVQREVGEEAFRYLVDDPACSVYIEHDDHLAGFPTSRVVVDFLSQDGEEKFQFMRRHK